MDNIEKNETPKVPARDEITRVLNEDGKPTFIDLTDLYEGGKADETKLTEYVKIAKEEGAFDSEKLDLGGGTLMTIYMAVAAEAGNSEKVQEIAFNNPAREGRVVLYSPEIAKREVALEKSLMVEQPKSQIDPNFPENVLDVRLAFSDDVEMLKMADSKIADKYMEQVIAQIRELKNQGQKVLRITGFPTWLIEGACFAASKEGMETVVTSALTKEVVVFDKSGELSGKMEVKKPENITLDLSDKTFEMGDVLSSKKLIEKLGVDISRANVVIENLDMEKIPQDVAIRMFDTIHSLCSSLKMSDVEIFNHSNPFSHDIVPKNKRANPNLKDASEREAIIIDMSSFEEIKKEIGRILLDDDMTLDSFLEESSEEVQSATKDMCSTTKRIIVDGKPKFETVLSSKGKSFSKELVDYSEAWEDRRDSNLSGFREYENRNEAYGVEQFKSYVLDILSRIIAKQSVNNASDLTFTDINSSEDLAVAGRVAHACHGLINKLSYRDEDKKEHEVKSWGIEKA